MPVCRLVFYEYPKPLFLTQYISDVHNASRSISRGVYEDMYANGMAHPTPELERALIFIVLERLMKLL